MAFPVTCVNNFYQNPDSVVKFANSLDARLTQVFFIDYVESYSFPIQRKNQFNI